MRPIGTIIAVGLVLVSGAAGAQAQTVVSRQITSEPVETVVTQGPNGTAVTRRILPPEPGVTSYVAPPPAYAPADAAIDSQYYVEPAAPTVITRRYVEPAAPAVTTRRVTTSRPTTVGISTRAPARTRAQTARRASPPPVVRTVTQTVVLPPPPDQALVLSPAQRQVLYRAVVQHEFYPPPAPVAAATGGYADYAYDPAYDRDYRDPYHRAYRWDGVPLTVGARVPASLPLYGVPEGVALRIPAVGSYSYAVVSDRGYLVDPATGVIVAEITQ